LKEFLRYILLTLLVLAAACSTKKDAFLNRNFHALTTKYNVLYNGKTAFDEGRLNIVESYEDNFWEILPVERLQVSEEILFPNRQPKNKNFEIAEEKAAKAIQKHSMNIAGNEKNPQMDEAFLLLGKARYIDQRFVPAQEAFNYILYKYPQSDKIAEAKIWREKTNIRLENEQIAIKNLERLLKQNELNRQDYVDANAFLGQAYINLNKIDTATAYLKEAAFTTKNHYDKSRYLFILGQLYENQQQLDSSDMAFREILRMKRKAPRMYWAHAQIKLAEHFVYTDGNDAENLKALTKLEENREARPYLDKIYYRIAEFHRQHDSLGLAEKYYNKSLREETPDKFLKALDYQMLGNFRFDQAEYLEAGLYYDSTLVNMDQTTLTYFRMKRKRDNLEDVIQFEETARVNDSILNLVSLSDEDRNVIFQNIIDSLKAKVVAEQKAIKEAEDVALDGANFLGLDNQNRQAASSSFQFYDQTVMAQQRMDFRTKWGNRNLSDNWRWKDRGAFQPQDQNLQASQIGENENLFAGEIYQLSYYTDKIPKDPQIIDSIGKTRNEAYYQLGLIYKERFKAYPVAADRLEILLGNNPEQKYVVPAKYNLYQIYKEINPDKAEVVKKEILTQHADSRFAEILRNPEATLTANADSPESVYNKLYESYKNQDFTTLETELNKASLAYIGDDMVPKFQLLKARTLARLDGLEAYQKSLENLSVDYPNSPEGKEAAQLLANGFDDIPKNEFTFDTIQATWKTLIPFKLGDSLLLKKQKEIILKAIDTLRYDYLFVTKDVYDRDNQFLVIHGFNRPTAAQGFTELLEVNKDFKLRLQNPIYIQSKHYEVIQIYKNLEAYLREFDKLLFTAKN
jgi:tetratricopeptide (TPR) repeat protein